MKQKKLLTVSQYAKLKGVTRGWIYIQIATGTIPKSKIKFETKKVMRIVVDDNESTKAK